MTTQTTNLQIVASLDRIASTISQEFKQRLDRRASADTEVSLPNEWHVYTGVTWEAAWSADLDFPGIFVHLAMRGLQITEDGEVHRGGPDINVGFAWHCHKERVAANCRLACYVSETLWEIAGEMGYAPHVHGLSSHGRPETTDWGVYGTVLFGVVDGAPASDKWR